jgi:hypothetical protein
MYIRYSYKGTGRQKPNKPIKLKTNILQGWYTGMYTEIANTKQGYMGKNRFENVIAEFASKFENLKLLAHKLQSTLFLIRDGDIFTGTFHNHDIMYNGMINTFSRAINRLGKEEQAIA